MYFPELSESFLKTLEKINDKKIAVIGHIRPDGDCIGSQVALCRSLNQHGMDAIAVNRDEAPRVLKSFIKDTPFLTATEFRNDKHIPILCDCADFSRQGDVLSKTFPSTFACIDHHISNKSFAEYNFIDATSSATAEILAGMFFDNNLPIDKVTAQALYIGIATDTGQFCYPSTTSRVFDICAKLCGLGADPGKATYELYERENFSKIKLLQHYLSTLKTELDGQVCIGNLSDHKYKELDLTYDESEGFVNYARSIEGVKIALILEQRGSFVKGSLRSKLPEMRVDQIAVSLGGGGHACAAGFSLETNIEDFYPELLKILKNHLEKVS